MIVTVASNKGGVGKNTTAIHLAANLQQFAPTLLVDNDPNRNSIGWAARSQNRLPFRLVDMNQSLKLRPDYEHIIFDTKARADRDELQTLTIGIYTAPRCGSPGGSEVGRTDCAIRSRLLRSSCSSTLIIESNTHKPASSAGSVDSTPH